MIKMIALDLDNTLLNSSKRISAKNQKILHELHQRQIKVVVCTGRPINAVWPYIDQLGLTEPDDYTITFNGGMVIRNRDRQVLSKTGLKLADFDPIHDYAGKHDLPLDILDFKQVYELTDLGKSSYQEVLNAPLQFVDKDFSDLSDQEYSKAIMSESVQRLDQARTDFPTSITDKYKIVRSQPQIMEFLPKQMSKAYGLNILLKHFDLDFSNLMAFGDAENDLEMLQEAQVGVAMENGSAAIKKAADATTLDNDSDGVAAYLIKYFAL